MPRPVIPRFRAIRSGWRKSAVAQAATLARGRPKIDLMNFMPPHDPARDSETIQAAGLASFPTDWRRVIRSVSCDATGCWVELKAPCTPEAARGIVEALAQAFEGGDVLVNGVSLRWEGEALWKYPGYPWTTTQEMIDRVVKLLGRRDGWEGRGA